jgi:hypothetical protein
VLDAGTTLEAGTHFAAVVDKPAIRATPKVTFTAPSTNLYTIRFRAETTGPIEFEANTLQVIATAVNGWTSVNNPLDGIPGHLVYDDPEYRLLQEAELANTGSTTPDAEEANLRQVAGVAAVKVLENDTDVVDGNGLPPHSTEALVWDNGGGATNNAIAQMIWDAGKAGGIRAYGQSSGTAVDLNGDSQIVNFTRLEELTVYLVFELEPKSGYVGDVAFAEKIAERANQFYGQGDDVIAEAIRSLPFDSGLNLGVGDLISFSLGFSPSPIGTANLPVGVRQIARFDAARIDVTS